MSKRIAEFSTFVYGTWCLRGCVTRNAPWERELCKKAFHALLILGNIGVKFTVCSLQVCVCHNPRSPVSRTSNKDDIQIIFLDNTVEMNIDEVQSGSPTPMAKQPRLHVLQFQRLFKQWIVIQIYLAD
jgi:hypothetical protein